MPRGDGTGPMGLGPMTGRAAGYCAGFGVPGSVNFVPGRGYWGRGRSGGRSGGRGWRNWYYATGLTGWQRSAACIPFQGYQNAYGGFYGPPVAPAMTREQEMDLLKGQAEYLEDALENIRRQLKELEGKTT